MTIQTEPPAVLRGMPAAQEAWGELVEKFDLGENSAPALVALCVLIQAAADFVQELEWAGLPDKTILEIRAKMRRVIF